MDFNLERKINKREAAASFIYSGRVNLSWELGKNTSEVQRGNCREMTPSLKKKSPAHASQYRWNNYLSFLTSLWLIYYNLPMKTTIILKINYRFSLGVNSYRQVKVYHPWILHIFESSFHHFVSIKFE
jgi:hypothetical protein